jgi:hypothetical protein
MKKVSSRTNWDGKRFSNGQAGGGEDDGIMEGAPEENLDLRGGNPAYKCALRRPLTADS